MYLEGLCIILEPQRGHGIQNILPSNRLAFLHVAFFGSFRGDEADELGDAFLDAFFSVFGDFGGRWDGLFHDARDVGDLQGVFVSGARCGADWAYGEETVLFSVLSHLLFGNGCRRGCLGRGRLMRNIVAVFWLRCERRLDVRHNAKKSVADVVVAE